MSKINSASRILDLFRAASSFQNTDKVFEVWSKVFEIPEADQNKKNIEISRCLGLMSDEIDSIKKKMELEVSDELQCTPVLDSLYRVLAVHVLMSDWKGVSPHLTREAFICLGFCRETLPSEEHKINEKDIDEIHELITALETQLENSVLPPYIKKIIQGHIDGIVKALHSYKIIGITPLQEVMKTVVGDVMVNEPLFKEAKGSSEITILGQLLKKIQKTADGVVKVEKYLGSGVKIAQHSSKLIDAIEPFM